MGTQSNIQNVMTANPICLGTHASMAEVGRIFKEQDIHHIPIVDSENKLCGIIGYSDFTTALDSMTPFDNSKVAAANERGLSSLIVKDYMASPVVYLRADHSIGNAIDIFRENRFHALPIVDRDKKVIGIITTYDLLLELSKESFIW